MLHAITEQVILSKKEGDPGIFFNLRCIAFS